ncbi:MAG: sulfatase [Planctomycetota bacterium]
MRARHLARFVVLCTLAAAAACGGDGPRRGPVMVLVLDALHAEHLGAYGGSRGVTATLDGLAARGLRFDRAFANANWTLPSTACLMTGRLQEQHRVVSRWHRLDPSHGLLSEVFADAGYRTGCWTQMPYAGETYGFGRGYDEFHYYGDGRESELREGGLTLFENLARWMGAMEGRPWFAYVHLRRPHSPYDPPPKLLARLDPDGPLRDGSRDDELRHADTFMHRELPDAERARAEALYLANLWAVDRAIERIVTEVERQGGLLVVTSDHGEALGTEGVWGHGIHLADDNLDVPLIVVGPGIEPGVSGEPVCSVDLFPTLLEWLGVPAPANAALAGRSYLPVLLEGAALPPRGPVVASGKHGLGQGLQVAVVDGDRKVVVELDGSLAAYERTGSGDRPLVGEVPPELADRVQAWRAQHAALFEAGRVDEQVDEAHQRALERLGYGEIDGAPAEGERPR